MTHRLTFAYYGTVYTVDLYFDREAGWHWTRVYPTDEHRAWAGQAAVERMEHEDRASWFDAKADSYEEDLRWSTYADRKYPSPQGGLNAKGS